MTLVVELVDHDGAPLAVPDNVSVVLMADGEPVATGVPRGAGTFGFDAEPRAGLAVRLEVPAESDAPAVQLSR